MTTTSEHQVLAVSDLDKQALEATFQLWKDDRAPEKTASVAFELFSIEQVLKDFDLTDEEIASGHIGGGDDGGIDGFYFFINRTLIQEETETPNPAITASLFIIQAKKSDGFAETTIEKLHSFTSDLLDYTKAPASLTYLNYKARDAISRFRTKYKSILGAQHTLSVSFHYLSLSTQEPNNKVKKRVENLQSYVKQQLSSALVSSEYWGSARLLKSARATAMTTLTIDVKRQFSTHDGCVVALAKLKDFARFLTNDHGTIRTPIFESNVRDYQGSRNAVNKAIREGLEVGDTKEFWWLNNGITILASSCSISGDSLSIGNPEIVNGLQTSQEIFSFFSHNPDRTDERTVLIKTIVPPDEQTRNRITKATNYQTPVDELSLHATDQIHSDIEDILKLHKLYYDRRKGQYRNQRKPIVQIVSMATLGKAVIACLLQQPDSARARPMTLLRKPEAYKTIYDSNFNRDLYASCILLDRQVEAFLDAKSDILHEVRRDIKYYVETWLMSELTNKLQPTANDIAAVLSQCQSAIDPSLMEESISNVLTIYNQLGGTDKVAKGPEFRTKMLVAISSHREMKTAA